MDKKIKKNSLIHANDLVTNADMFKELFSRYMLFSILKARLLCGEDVDLAADWRDWSGQALIGTTTIVTTGVISILVAAGFTMALTGFAIPISLAGLGIGIGYNMHRTRKRKHEHARITRLFAGRDVQMDIEELANRLTELYSEVLDVLTRKDIQKFAFALGKLFIRGMKKKKIYTVEQQLFYAPNVMYFLRSQAHHLPKKKLEMAWINGNFGAFNIRSLVKKTGIRCAGSTLSFAPGNNTEKVRKYGFVRFETPEDLQDFRQLCGDYEIVSANQTSALRTHSLFGSVRPTVDADNAPTPSL